MRRKPVVGKKEFDEIFREYKVDITEAEKEFHNFVKTNKEGFDVLFQSPVINFLLAKIQDNIVYLMRTMVNETDDKNIKVLQGQIKGLNTLIEILKETETVRKTSVIENLTGILKL